MDQMPEDTIVSGGIESGKQVWKDQQQKENPTETERIEKEKSKEKQQNQGS